MKRWLVLDRDGVINHDSDDYIKNADEWLAIPGSLEAIARLNQAGYHVLVASNQAGIGRGLFQQQDLEAMHQKMHRLLATAGGRIRGVYYCSHHPDESCQCRKPKTGMLDSMERDHKISLKGCSFVGDSEKDLQAAITKGCTPILVRTGKGERTLQRIAGKTQYRNLAIFDNLSDFADFLLKETSC
ncbi:MAG: D-glycero-beta-D-manno-heptose-1,7-bisphosphate 7-phosphatase [Alteromonadaceae bacterium]|nr:MAG: D-glycero-beta-D-manno-heptose-1,7-bisphosphate 7-phosphatase [Alteromonadaceae bacterium]